MQSSRKNSGSYSTIRNQSTPNLKKKYPSIAVQTEHVPHFDDDLCNFKCMSVEEIREQYRKSLQFLNSCHEFINSVLGSSSGGNMDKLLDFKVPEVPNYFNMLDIFLEHGKLAKVGDVSPTKAKFEDDEPTVFDLQQFLPKNVDDSRKIDDAAPAIETKGSKNAEVYQVSVFNKKNLFEWSGSEIFPERSDGSSKRSISPSRLVKSEKSIVKKPCRQDFKAISSTFEEILKTCNEFEQKSIEYLLKNDVPLNEPNEGQKKIKQKQERVRVEKLEQGDQAQRSVESEESFPSVSGVGTSKSSSKQGFNLLEYALKNCKPAFEDSAATSKELSSLLMNFQSLVKSDSNKSLKVLNQPSQSHSQHKVNEMFKKISTENFDSVSVNFSEGSEDLMKFTEDEVDTCEINLRCEWTSSGSTILNDEEYQQRLIEGSTGTRRQRKCKAEARTQVALENSRRTRPIKSSKVRKPEPPKQSLLKSIPLQLSQKDKASVEAKDLQAMGLFTETGDIRPDIINVIEEKQRRSYTQNQEKNVQFRKQRKLDLEVRFNNNKMKVTENTSGESIAENGSLVSHQKVEKSWGSSAVSISPATTISDSDLLRIAELNSREMSINKIS